MGKTAIVIGSGLGGLECAQLLARHGMKVIVLEQSASVGGCLQGFKRKATDGRTVSFDTGFHYVGGLGEGQPLWRLFKYFGLLDLPWKKLDDECFDEVSFDDGTSYPFACGHETFVERLAELFPHQRAGLVEYASVLKNVGDHIFDAFDGNPSDLFGVNAHEFLNAAISDPKLRNVLSGTSLKMELAADSLPLYVFAQINNSFIQSAWRLDGGGPRIAERLAEQVTQAGGEIRTGARVTRLNEAGGRIVSVQVNGEETISADWFVSDAHPAIAMDLLGETKAVRKIYRSRIGGLKNTFGMFTANVALKPEALPYLNRNLYVHRTGADLWRPDVSRTDSIMVHFYPSGSAIDILSPMPYAERDSDYVHIKEQKLQECLDLASVRLPGLKDAIDSVWTSTPLTWHDNTFSPGGSAYGMVKDCRNPLGTIISPRTPLPNLLLTGQSLNLHGILGVSMTSILTCARILGMETLSGEIFKA